MLDGPDDGGGFLEEGRCVVDGVGGGVDDEEEGDGKDGGSGSVVEERVGLKVCRKLCRESSSLRPETRPASMSVYVSVGHALGLW